MVHTHTQRIKNITAIFRGLNGVDGMLKMEPPKARGHAPRQKKAIDIMNQKRGFTSTLKDKKGCSTMLMNNTPKTKETKEVDSSAIKIGVLVSNESKPHDENITDSTEASVSTKQLNLTDSGKLKGLDLASAIARLRVAIA